MPVVSIKAARKDQLWHRIRGAVDGYAAGIVRLIGEAYGVDTVQQAWREFTLGEHQAFNCSDPHAELFFSWLFHRWSPTREKGSKVGDSSLYGVSPTRAYLDRNSSRLHPLLQRYLETCLVTSPGFYQVINCRPNIGFEAHDVLTGEEREVSEELASTSLANGDIMFAHLIPLEGTTMLEAISPLSFPPTAKDCLKRMYRGHAHHVPAAPQPRELYFALAQSALYRSAQTVH
jgi:hypothetical protein